jgi:hypothetical protein
MAGLKSARSPVELDVVHLYLDAFALRVRSMGKEVSVPTCGLTEPSHGHPPSLTRSTVDPL